MDDDVCSVCMADMKPGDEKAVKTAPVAVAAADAADSSSSAALAVSNATTSNAIAQLTPCGHLFHDECVRSWTERANSCPLCRQTFNVVNISAFLGGPSITQYAVQDRKQRTESEYDWSLTVDSILPETCCACGLENNSELLLPCANCSAPYHTYCINEEATPYSEWYCEDCKAQAPYRFGDATDLPTRSRRAPRATARRFSGGASRDPQRRIVSSLEEAQALARLYASHQHRVPAAVESSAPVAPLSRSGHASPDTLSGAQQHDHDDSASNNSSSEEQSAWDAFEIARQVEMEEPSSNGKRAKSVPKSEDPAPQPERKLKRPRTRRMEQVPKPVVAESAERVPKRKREDEDEPSFLSSELKRVEAYNVTAGPARKRMATASLGLTSAVLPKYPQPSHSPGPSSPTSASPEPEHRFLPKFGSEVLTPLPKENYFDPVGQSLRIARSYSNPQSPEASSPTHHPDFNASAASPSTASSPQPQHYTERPPTRHAISPAIPTTKSIVLEMVRNELRPFLRAKEITGEDFEFINRSVTHQIYTEVDDISALQGEAKATWQDVAKQRVQKAVHEIKHEVIEPSVA